MVRWPLRGSRVGKRRRAEDEQRAHATERGVFWRILECPRPKPEERWTGPVGGGPGPWAADHVRIREYAQAATRTHKSESGELHLGEKL
jgi:hypothetical protein